MIVDSGVVKTVGKTAGKTVKTVSDGLGSVSGTLSDILFYSSVVTESVLQYIFIPMCLYKMSKNNQLGTFFGKGTSHQSLKNVGIAIFVMLYIYGDVMSIVSTVQSVRCKLGNIKEGDCRPSLVVRRGVHISKIIVLVLAVMGLSKYTSSISPIRGASINRY